jgi:hypothetical protein
VPLSRTLIAAGALLLAACAGNGDGLDSNGRPLAPGSGTVPLSADFKAIQANILTPICSVCHVGGAAPEGLRLDATDSFNLLVGVPSTEVPSLMRVRPSDPNNSYIIQKLEGHAAVGAQMPLGGPYLSTDTIAFVRQWITNGAPPSAAAAGAAPFAVTSVVPDGAEPLSEPPPQIMLAFNHELDVTQIDALSAHIEKLSSGVPRSATEETSPPEMIPARISVSSANLMALMVWPGRALGEGRYRVVIGSGSTQVFTDIAGQSIAGTPNDLGGSVITTFEVGAAQ